MQSNRLIRHLFPSFLTWDIPSEKKELYLTFDDGPVKGKTHKILDILDDFNIKATFFCVGENIHKHNDDFLALLSKKHVIGNHTYNHLNGWKTKKDVYLKNVDACNKLIESPFFRPPYGRITPLQAFELKDKYKIIMWSVLTYDFNQKLTPDTCLKNSIEKTRNGSIVVFHDNIKAEKNLNYTLPRYIEHFLNKDFVFKTL